MAPPPIKSNKQHNNNVGGKKPEESEFVSNNLWVGNLAADVTDSDIRDFFGKHAAVDSITSYPSRSYAFVYLKSADDAKTAKDALQGAIFHGFALKIEFAKPAKPCKSLWVSGISSSVSKEELEEEFSKFGEIEDFKFIRDKNTAYVDYFRLEDASQALNMMNGKKRGGNPIRVDFLRSHSRRELGPDFRGGKDGNSFSRNINLHDSPWIPQDLIRNHPDPSQHGSKRQQPILPSGGRKGDAEPNNILCISYPPSVHIDEQMLHNAMILFGEIESIRSFPSRHYALVEFRSVEEAQCAKEGLQGQLFNDPRILIMFSSNDHTYKDFPGFLPGIRGPRPETFFNEIPFQQTQAELYHQNRPVVPNSFHGCITPRGGSDTLVRPFAPPGGFESVLPNPEFNDLSRLHKMPEPNPLNLVGGPNWRRSSPSPGVLHSPTTGLKQSIRPVAGPWDVFDASQLQRDPKRPRTVGTLSSKEMSDMVLGADRVYQGSPQVNEGSVAPIINVQRKNHLSTMDTRLTTSRTNMGHPNIDYLWRGIIAKGGTPVCHARCVPIGEWIGYEIPEVINCSARTGLDMLAKHYADAIGFNIIFFLPDSEDDFASYTEFLRYLGDKNRAGVAKFDDGTTLFLVPPSDFLTNVLNVVGPERLYGVVLKFPQHASSSTSMHLNFDQPQYIDKRQVPSLNEYGVTLPDERVLQLDSSSLPQEDTKPGAKSLGPSSNNPPVYLIPPVGTSSTPPTGLSLTPELIATLTSLLPAKENSSNVQQPSGSAGLRPVSTSVVSDRAPLQGWNYERLSSENSAQLMQQHDSSFNSQTQNTPQLQTYPSISNNANLLEQAATGSTQIQDPTFNMSQHDVVSSLQIAGLTAPSHSGTFGVPLQASQYYLPEIRQNLQSGYGLEHKTDAYQQFPSSVLQSATNAVTSSNQIHGDTAYQPESVISVAGNNSNLQLPDQVQQLQSALYGATQGTPDIDTDKNERYRSTLQFAANLLFQIHQQQPGTQASEGAGNH